MKFWGIFRHSRFFLLDAIPRSYLHGNSILNINFIFKKNTPVSKERLFFQNKSIVRLLLTMCSLFFLTNCGFRLHGAHDIPKWIDNVSVIDEANSPYLAQQVEDQLAEYQRHVISDPRQANYWLVLTEDKLKQNIISVSSSTTPRQYLLVYTVRFKLLKHIAKNKAKTLFADGLIVVTRQWTANSNRILGSDYEQKLTEMEMKRDAAMQIINELGENDMLVPH